MNKNWRELISQPQYAIKIERDITVRMRDGIDLAVNVYRPAAEGRFPALLAMSGYGKEEMELLLPPQPLNKSAVWDGNIEAGDFNDIVPRGYVHIIGDFRGTGHSGGEYPGPNGRDCAELVEWAAGQPWCNGNVGMIGYSAFSAVQLNTAFEQPPHLKCIAVSHISTDTYRENAYNGGVLSLMAYGLWYGRHGTSGIAPNNAASSVQKALPKEEFERRRQELLNHPDIKYYPNVYHLLLYPRKNPRFFDMLMNPYDGPWYYERSAYPYFDRIKIPVHITGKCAHETMGYWDVYEGVKTPRKLLVKPNGPEERPWREDLETLIRWYDHWLKGNDTGMMEEPPIRLFVMGENKWRSASEWPLPGIEYTKCYLRRWEGLSFEPELHQDEPDGFFQQPLHVSNKRDSVVYLSPPLDEELQVIGPASITFFASIDQDDTNWIVKLFDVAPNGVETRLCKSFLKASHRALDPQKSRPYAPYHPHTRESIETIKPGKIYEYNIALNVIQNVFKEDHRIKLSIESLESPRDPELQIHYHPHLNTSKATLHKIFRDRVHRSHLLLPVILGKREKPEIRQLPQTMSDDNCLLLSDYSVYGPPFQDRPGPNL
ncbi:MAG: CocE/NonD family hydrolase [Dehalococcoidales bacterium]|nr:CocE/NonD family hydrolase [Dehalococcoidales bacterium]